MSRRTISPTIKPPLACKFVCQYCKKEFQRESAASRHTCTKKQRHENKATKPCLIAFDAYSKYFKQSFGKVTTYEQFAESKLFNGFLKFGEFCTNTYVINRTKYLDHLFKENLKLDLWHLDSTYTQFLVTFLRNENHVDAVQRSVETLCDLCEEHDVDMTGVFFLHASVLCSAIVSGKLSPWLLYNYNDGIRFLDQLGQEHVKMVYDYVDPSKWAVMFSRRAEDVVEVKQLIGELLCYQ